MAGKEQRIIERLGEPRWKASSGEPYITFITSAVKEEDEQWIEGIHNFPPDTPEWCVWKKFGDALTAYLLNERAAIIEWRRVPEFNRDQYGTRIFSRLAVVARTADIAREAA